MIILWRIFAKTGIGLPCNVTENVIWQNSWPKSRKAANKNPFEGKRFNAEIQFLDFREKDFLLVTHPGFVPIIENNYKNALVLIPGLYTTDIAQPPELG